MKNYEESRINNLIKSFLYELGISKEVKEVQSYLGAPSSLDRNINYAIVFEAPVKYIDSYEESVSSKLVKIQDAILESPIVKREINNLEQKLKMANAASDELLLRIKELEKYKNYYDMQFKLNHGEIINELSKESR